MSAGLQSTKILERARNLHARAVHAGTPAPEAESALRFLMLWLNKHRPSVRYCYPKGTEIKLIPTRALNTAQAQRQFRIVRAHRAGALTENQRCMDESISNVALAKLYLPFSRHGYYVFVPVRALEIRV